MLPGKDGHLIVADAFHGIFKINVDSGTIIISFLIISIFRRIYLLSVSTHSGEKTHLVSPDEMIDGKTAKTFNSVAPAKDGKIYYTVSW